MRNVLITQVFVIVAVTVIFAGAVGAASAWGAAFGAGIALANSLLIAWRISRGGKLPEHEAGYQLRSAYASAIERFVMVAVLFVIGFGSLRLEPLPLLTGFIAGQTALLLTGLTSRNR